MFLNMFAFSFNNIYFILEFGPISKNVCHGCRNFNRFYTFFKLHDLLPSLKVLKIAFIKHVLNHCCLVMS